MIVEGGHGQRLALEAGDEGSIGTPAVLFPKIEDSVIAERIEALK